MTNYIVNKTTTEVFAAVADSMPAAIKTVEQGNGVPMNVSVAYNARPQTQTPNPLTPVGGVPQMRPLPIPQTPIPQKVASKKS